MLGNITAFASAAGLQSELAVARYSEASLIYRRPVEKDPALKKTLRRPDLPELERTRLLLRQVKEMTSV